MASEEFTPEEIRRLNALANAAKQRLQELLESETNTPPSKSRSPRNKRQRKASITSADNEEVEQDEDEEEEYSGDRAVAVIKRMRCNNSNIIIPNKNNKKEPMDDGPTPPPPLPEDFKKVIQEIAGGRHVSEEKLVIQKGLYETDLARTQNRLSIPFTKVCDHEFLTEEEAQLLTTRDEKNKKKYKEVTIIEPSLRLERVKLTRWDMNKDNGRNASSQYVINGTWKHIVDRNKLTSGMVVQIWSFRVEHVLHLALVKLAAP